MSEFVSDVKLIVLPVLFFAGFVGGWGEAEGHQRQSIALAQDLEMSYVHMEQFACTGTRVEKDLGRDLKAKSASSRTWQSGGKAMCYMNFSMWTCSITNDNTT